MAHIGIDARLLYYRTGGISTYIRQLIAALEQLDAHNRYTTFYSWKDKHNHPSRFRRAGLFTPAHHRLERLALSVELTPRRLDLLHSPDFIPPLRGARRHVITVHDLNFLHYPQYLTADSRRYYNDQIEAAVRHADHILADSEATRLDLVTMLHVPAEQITVAYSGVDSRFAPLPPAGIKAGLAALGLPQGYILHVGTLEPRKNISGLLRAYRGLLDDLPDLPPVLLIGRRGWHFEALWEEISALKLNERLLWRNDIPDEQLPLIYNGATCLILPSFYEGFGLPALEAMACGIVPLVTNRSSPPEVVGELGLQFNPDDDTAIAAALRHALTDSAWRAAQAPLCIARATTFTWRACAEVALSAYQRALA